MCTVKWGVSHFRFSYFDLAVWVSGFFWRVWFHPEPVY